MSDKEDDKEVTQPGTAIADYFQKYGDVAAPRNFVGSLLRFTKFGEYAYGAYDEELKHGSRLAAHMQTLTIGWQEWRGNRPARAVMGLLVKGFEPPQRKALGDTDKTLWETDGDGKARDPWQFTNMLVLSDPHTRELYTFTTSSRGGLGAIGELSKKYSSHLRVTPDEVPIVALEMGSYRHRDKSFGEIRYPILKPVEWMPSSQLPPIDGSEPEALAAPEPAPKQKPASPPRRKAKDTDENLRPF
jgi:hypothetical protein